MNLLADFMVSFEVRAGTLLLFEGHRTGENMIWVRCTWQDELTLLLSNMPVLLYSGQLDIIIGAATTERYLQEISWAGASRTYNYAHHSIYARNYVCRIESLDVWLCGRLGVI